jgi:hypothetical protein
VDGYSRMLQHFFGALGKPPDKVTSQEVFVHAHGVGPSGKEPSAVTIGARMACVNSFYRFLIRMEIVSSNPCDQLDRCVPNGLGSAGEQRMHRAARSEAPIRGAKPLQGGQLLPQIGFRRRGMGRAGLLISSPHPKHAGLVGRIPLPFCPQFSASGPPSSSRKVLILSWVILTSAALKERESLRGCGHKGSLPARGGRFPISVVH